MKLIQEMPLAGRTLVMVLPSVICMFFYAAQLTGQSDGSWPLILSLVVVLVTAGFAYLAFSGSMRQLVAIDSTLQTVHTDKDLSSRVDIVTADSIGVCAKAINELLDNLTVVQGRYVEYSSKVMGAIQNLCGVSGCTDQSFAEQHGPMEQFVHSVSELTGMIHHIADNTKTAAEATEVARSHTQSGALVATNAMCSIEAVFNSLDNADEVIELLNERTRNVGVVLDVIGDVSEQTNLLALNAAIEAARAGEQGRGFAVVADEVRSLAGKTQDSIGEIQHIIEQLQDGTRMAVKRMGEARSQAHESVVQMEESAESLGMIAGEVATLVEMNHRIAEAACQQDELANSLNQGIESINSLMESDKSESEIRKQYSDELLNLSTGMQDLGSKV